MPRGLDLAVDVVVTVGCILEPLGAEGAVTVLEFGDREVLVVADVLVSPQVGAVELARGPQPPLATVGEAEQTMRATAGSPANRLHDLLLDEPRERPLPAIAADPRGVSRQVMSQRDEGEGEFGLRLARLLLLLDQVGDRECLALHRERGVGRDAALGEDREVLGGVPLHADAL